MSSPEPNSTRSTAWALVAWCVAAVCALIAAFLSMRAMGLRAELAAQEQASQLAQLEVKSLEQRLEAEHILDVRQISDFKQHADDATRQIADLERAADVAQLKIVLLNASAGAELGTVAIAVWNPLKQEGVLSVMRLPTLENDGVYDLWLAEPGKTKPAHAAAFSVNSAGAAQLKFHPEQPMGGDVDFLVTREAKAGSPQPTDPVVAASRGS